MLSGVAKGQKKSRQLTTFQVDLQYPEPAHSSSSSSKAATTASPKTVGSCGSCPPSPLLLPQSPDKCPSPMPTHMDPGAAVTPLSLAGALQQRGLLDSVFLCSSHAGCTVEMPLTCITLIRKAHARTQHPPITHARTRARTHLHTHAFNSPT